VKLSKHRLSSFSASWFRDSCDLYFPWIKYATVRRSAASGFCGGCWPLNFFAYNFTKEGRLKMELSGPQVFGLIAFVITVGTCGLYSTFAHSEMLEQVNAKLPSDRQFSPLGWYYSKHRRLLSEYRRLYPSGALDNKLRFLGTIMTVAIVVTAWRVGMPFTGVLWLGIVGGFSLWFTYRR
jgi:hypothetical protein